MMTSSFLRHTTYHVTSTLAVNLLVVSCLSHLSHAAAFRIYAGLTGRTYNPSLQSLSSLPDPPRLGMEGDKGRLTDSIPGPGFPPDVQYENLFHRIGSANDGLENDVDSSDSAYETGPTLNPGVRVNLQGNIWKEDSLRDLETGREGVADLLRDSKRNLEMLLALKQNRHAKTLNSLRFSEHEHKQPTLNMAEKRGLDPPMRHRYGGDVFRIARRRYQSSPASVAALAAVARRNSADAHPVYLGLGQEAAEAALDTLARIMAEDTGRGSREPKKPTETINFIG